MNFPRASGILLHPTSLPGRFGIGDFGDRAFEFVDFLASAGQTYWQVLPLNPTGYRDSPYQCISAFAGNTLLISLDKVVEDGFLSAEDIEKAPDFPAEKVDFGEAQKFKTRLLKKAFESFKKTDDQQTADLFHTFCHFNAFWLEDFTLYRALKLANNQASWLDWADSLKLREPEALEKARGELDEEIFAEKFYQFLFFKQWDALKDYCKSKGVEIIGDVPIFVALDSADVWSNPQQFKLNEDGTPRVVSGVPPDYFSKTGQLWGNPIYDWDAMRNDGFHWWIERMRFSLKMFDVVRIDHFLGFVRAWEVPGADETAEHGEWTKAPGKELFAALTNALRHLPVMAEDLGEITPEAEDLRDSFGFPGMRILQYGFGGDARNIYLPHNFVPRTVVYTGTHDNDTISGWFDLQNAEVRKFCLKYLNSDGKRIHWDFIRAALASVAQTAIFPLQDLLGLGNDARMNLPASEKGNWQWRCSEDDFNPEIAEKLKDLTEIYGRNLERFSDK